MKKLLGLILALAAIVPVARAANLTYSGLMPCSEGGYASSTAQLSTKTCTMDMTKNGGDILGAQLIYSSATVPSISLTDGSASTFTITVISTSAIAGAKASDTITVSTNSALSAARASVSLNVVAASTNALAAIGTSTITITVALPVGTLTTNATYYFVSGVDYQVGVTSNATAVALAANINSKINHSIASYFGFQSSAYSGVTAAVSPVGGTTITIVANSSGTLGNLYTVKTTTTAFLLTGGTTGPVNLSGGLDKASITFWNGASSITWTNGNQWNSDLTYSSNTAVAIANVFNQTDYGVTAATTSTTVVTLTANRNGTYANSYALSASTGALAIGSANFSGGQNNASVYIGTKILTNGTDWATPGASSTTANVATAIAAAINASSATIGYVAQAISNVVTSTAVAVGPGYAIATSTQSALTIAPYTSSSPVTGIATGTSVGGSSASYALNGQTFYAPAHGLTTGYAVSWSTSSGVNLSPLAYGVTYYAIYVDDNDFALSLTSTGSVAGSSITFVSSQTKTTTDTFTVNPSAISGSAGFQILGSNNNVNYVQLTSVENGVSVSSVTFSSPYTAGSTLYPIGFYPWRYLRFLFNGQTWGGVNYSFWVFQKNGAT